MKGMIIENLAYLEMGFNAVNVEYRFTGDALAPAAVPQKNL